MPLPIQAASESGVEENSSVDLKAYARILLSNRWQVLVIALAVTLAGILFAIRAKPVYEANMLIHVEEVNPNASKNILTEVSSIFETKKAAIAEMELLRSRTVISPAVDKLLLYIEVQPKYFPLIGSWLAEHAGQRLSEPGIAGRGGYVWAAERMSVSTFDVPRELENRQFIVTAMDHNRYQLSDLENRLTFVGIVGSKVRAATSMGAIELKVDQLAARPGGRFLLRRVSRSNVIAQIQKSLLISELGKQSGVIEVKLRGATAKGVNAVLTEICNEYMRQNLARQTEEAEKSLAFLNRQLPELRQQLEQSEAQYNAFRNSHGTVDLVEEAKISLQQAAAAKTRRVELLQKRTEMLTRFTDEHPVVAGINLQLRQLDDEIGKAATHIKSLPLMEQEQGRLTRDIKVNTDLYTALSNTAQQLRIVSVGKVSNVRLVDAPAMPDKAIGPNRGMIVGVAAAVGLALGVLVAIGRKALQGGIDDPKKVERMLGSRAVYATIPHSGQQKQLNRQTPDSQERRPLLAQVFPEDPAIEILRSFRAALAFAMPQFKNNIVMFTGPTPGLGKSFVSSNFAAVMAASGKRVLLIDADLHNGHLHEYFGGGRQQGLTETITGEAKIEQVIRRQLCANLDFISTGALPQNRSEFLMHVNFAAVLEKASAKYDLVLVDAPPVLAVADALIVGAHAGAVFLMVRAGLTTQDEIVESIKRLSQAGIAPQGILFNDLKPGPGLSSYQYQYGGARQLEAAT
jgi:tyrosine-protein kinase Etk/Wzc